jgi:hypothetical protein
MHLPKSNSLIHLSSHTRLFIAAVAPADAKPASCFALTLLVTRGKLLPAFAGARTAPVEVRLLPAVEGTKPLTTDCLRVVEDATGLLGLAPLASLCLTAVPFLKLVAGGSGRGRLPDGVAVTVLLLFIGDSVRAVMRAAAVDIEVF